MALSGLLLVADAAATLAWQEPLSALLAEREQRALERELSDQGVPTAPTPAAAVPRRTEKSSGRSRPSSTARRVRAPRPRRGAAIGRIELPSLDSSFVVVEGTGTEELRRGPGHFPGTPLPGQRGTVAVAGHRTTYGAPFRTVDRLRRGDAIVVRMPYGRFSYRVESTRIVAPTATWVTRRVDHDRLVLTACHPLYSAAQRIVVFARAV